MNGYNVGEVPAQVEPMRRRSRINGIKWDELPDKVKMDLVTKTKRKFLTRNSPCPCGRLPLRRFKRCCGKGLTL